MKRALLALFGLFCSLQVVATINAYPFESTEQEKQFNELINELRCPKCQNQTISDSDAPLAKDLKDKTYEMVIQGQSKQDVIDYMTARYGHFVHYQPPVQTSTWVLWFGPFVFLTIALFTLVWLSRSKKAAGDAKLVLSDEDQKRLAELMKKDEPNS